jgi:hypothetical protein
MFHWFRKLVDSEGFANAFLSLFSPANPRDLRSFIAWSPHCGRHIRSPQHKLWVEGGDKKPELAKRAA